MIRARAWTAATFLFALLCGCGLDEADAPPPETAPKPEALVKQADKGPLHLTVTVSPKAPRLSDLIELTLSATAEPEVEITPPAFGQAVGEFQIRDYRPLDPRMENGKTVRGWIYKLEPVRSGKHIIRAMGVTFVDRRAQSEAKDKPLSLEVDPIEIEVTSLLGSAKPDLGALAPMEEPRTLAPRPWPAWVWAALGGGVLAMAAAAVAYLRRKKKSAPPEPERTPEELARTALDTLMRDRLPEQGLFVEYYVRLTGIVRLYVERKTGIRAPEQTTEEFLRAMRGDARFDPELSRQLGHFLEASDLVKYAARHPDGKDMEEAYQRALTLVSVSAGHGLVRAPEPALAAAGGGKR
ncbi:MAG: hypothetical protein KIS92_05335 [Planctomycetota bacterium]|nr:hypothetical protein [Planctomycetota bacterium]